MRYHKLSLFFLILATSRMANASFTYEKVKDLVISHDTRTPEELMSVLPAHLRSRFVLAHTSQSLQNATSLCPRTILSEDDGTLLLAFSGVGLGKSCLKSGETLKEKPGDNTLEIIQYRHTSRSFDFKRLNFSKTLSPEGRPLKPSFEENPTQCAACHSHPVRPIWDYPMWPKFYGSVGYLTDFGIFINSQEGRDFKDFISKNSHSGIYQNLVGLSDKVHRPGEFNFSELPQNARFYFPTGDASWSRIRQWRPQTYPSQQPHPSMLSKLEYQITKLNLERVAKVIFDREKDIQKIKAIVATSLQCHNIEDFSNYLPLSMVEQYKNTQEERVALVKRKRIENVDRNFTILPYTIPSDSTFLPSGFDYSLKTFFLDSPIVDQMKANVLFVLGEENFKTIFLDLKSESYQVPVTESYGFSDLVMPLAELVFKDDPKLAWLDGRNGALPTQNQKLCAELRRPDHN